MGRSSCIDPNGFFCNNQETWITEEGWYQTLRAFNMSALDSELNFKKELLWLYAPNFMKQGTVESIDHIPATD